MQHLKELSRATSHIFVSAVVQFLFAVLSAEAAGNPAWEEATKLYNAKNYTAALAAFRKISEANPTDPSTHYMLGQCYKALNKKDQAIIEFKWVSTSSDPRMKGIALGALKQLGQNSSAIPLQSADGPPRDFINDSAAQTINFAYNKGWVPCTGGCLTFAKPGWHHKQVAGHPDSDQWMSFTYNQKDGSSQTCSYNQRHIGHVIKENSDAPATDTGPCSVCHGLGWVRWK
jgi:hypothetical protein